MYCQALQSVVSGGSGGADQRRDRGAACRQTAAECRGALKKRAVGRAGHTGFCGFCERVDLSSLSLLNLSAAVSRGAADLHCGCYDVIILSSSILTAECRGNVQWRGGLQENRQTRSLW